ncbi:MAG: ABC transporter ATP-binding protein [Candidatus Thorarchaeota archaeon]|nr:ABC transporter ATP-binding protein [Candidatus Thorarchaeota archaeon]
MVRVEVEGMVRRFADGTRIGPIDLTVEDGELMCLLGPSGSGKSTTLRMIAGFISAESGHVKFDGRDMAGVPPRARGIGMVFQWHALFPNMSVMENIAFGPDIAGWTESQIRERVLELSDMLEIRHLLGRRVRELSGGEQQRVSLARALATRPSLLLLDEPLSSLDLVLRERLQSEIRSIQKRLGVTTVYVTHSQEEAFAIADRVAVLNEGVVLQTGTPRQIYDMPSSAFVASFVGRGNLLDAVVLEDYKNGRLSVEVCGGVFQAIGSGAVGTRVTVTIKPEDVIITARDDPHGLPARVVALTCGLGMTRALLDINGIRVTSLTAQRELPHLSEDAHVNVQLRDGSLRVVSKPS